MKAINILIAISIFLLFMGCSKEEHVSLSGNIVGFVNLIDENGNNVNDKSGVTASIDQLNRSAISDLNGRFELNGIPAGTYNITCNKEKYGTTTIYSYQFIGGNIPSIIYERTLYEIPKTEVLSLDAIISNHMLNISGQFSKEPTQYSLQIFINDSSNVSNLNYDYTSVRTRNFHSSEHFEESLYLPEDQYNSGDKIYLVMYLLNPKDWGYYNYEKQESIISTYKKVTDVILLTVE
jgi:hypothetical protein